MTFLNGLLEFSSLFSYLNFFFYFVQDQVLLGMQQKLDTLCEQVNYFMDQPETAADAYDYFLCEQHFNQSNNFFEVNNPERLN